MGRRNNYQTEVNLVAELVKALGKLFFEIGKALLWVVRKKEADKQRAEIARRENTKQVVDASSQARYDRLIAKLNADLMEEEQAQALLESGLTK